MTNYIVEEGLNLWDLITDTTVENNQISICLLSGEKLTNNHVTLPCGHTFNYATLVEELIALHKPTTYCNRTLPLCSLICPYCRQISKGLLLHIQEEIGLQVVRDVTTNKISLAIPHYQCQYIFKSGKAKGTYCTSKHAYYNDTFTLCHKHHKSNNLTKDKDMDRDMDRDKDKDKNVANKCPELLRCSRAELIAFLCSRGKTATGTKTALAFMAYELLGSDSPSLIKVAPTELK